MRFGQSAEEAEKDTSRGGSGGDFIRYLKDGDTTFRILQEPQDWVYYWEHFNPSGYSFPCDSDDRENCPGCTSDVEKMKKASRKIAFNVLQSYGGTEYVNVYKVPSTLADKLKNRYARVGTITDRDYTITRYKGAGDKVDYDVEGGDKSKVDMSSVELKDVEEMLAQQFEEQWGDSAQPKPSSQPEVKEEPKAEKTVTEDDLRKMTVPELKVMCVEEMSELPPSNLKTSDEIVDWMMVQA